MLLGYSSFIIHADKLQVETRTIQGYIYLYSGARKQTTRRNQLNYQKTPGGNEMNNKLTRKAKTTFESIKHIDEDGNEFWMSRDLALALGYSDYRNFRNVGRKAFEACKNSGINPMDHFVETTDMIIAGKGAERQVNNVKMSRYACYLAVQNADPSKTIDHMGSTELAANLFRTTQTEEKLREEKIKGKNNANKVHKEVGAKVRKAIKDIGGTMPEDLPVADSIKKLERKEKKLKQLNGNSESNRD